MSESALLFPQFSFCAEDPLRRKIKIRIELGAFLVFLPKQGKHTNEHTNEGCTSLLSAKMLLPSGVGPLFPGCARFADLCAN